MDLRDELRRMGVPEDMIATAMVNGRPLPQPRHRSGRQDRMNKTEALYSLELEAARRAGEIQRWAFQPLKFRLADRTWYTPDFVVWLTDGGVRIVEVKGGHVRDDAAVKFKIARELYPEFEWVCMQRTRSGWRELFV